MTHAPSEHLFEELLKSGLDGCGDQRALEKLLYFAMAPDKAEELSCRLIRRFGSLSGVMDASAAALGGEQGVSDCVVVLIKLIPQLRRKAALEQRKGETGKRRVIRTLEEASAYLEPYFYGCAEETAFVLLLNGKNEVVGCPMVGQGSETAVSINVRLLVSEALKSGSEKLYLAHCHPRGNPQPSQRDREVTKRLSETLKNMDIELIEHLIFSDHKMTAVNNHFRLK